MAFGPTEALAQSAPPAPAPPQAAPKPPTAAKSTTKGTKASKKRPAPTAKELYEQALRAMQRGSHTKALELFTRVRNYHRDDPLSVKAQLAIADLYFKQADYEQARFAYEEFATYHPRHEDLDYVTWRIGFSVYKRASRFAGRDQTSTRGAVNIWTGFDRRFPDSEYNEDVAKYLYKATDRLAVKELYVTRFYAGRKAWGSVQGRTEYLLRRYPETDRVAEALYWRGRSLHAWGDVAQAQEVRERLSTLEHAGTLLARLDRALAKPSGERPEEKVFVRPYRIRGLGADGAGF